MDKYLVKSVGTLYMRFPSVSSCFLLIIHRFAPKSHSAEDLVGAPALVG